jgi:phospholipid/cholesterol/gamma-HCH transport system substrate-binding protein
MMERQANYALVGVVGIALLIFALVFVIWLAQFQFNQKYDNYRVYLHGPVSGLRKGGPVQFNGIEVGEITGIALDSKDPNKVVTDLQVEHGTPVRTDSTALAVNQGITGVKYLQITPGTPERPLLRDVSGRKRPVIIAGRGRMEDFLEDLGKLTSNGREALDRINRVLSDENMGAVSSTLASVNATTSELNKRKTMFARMDSAFAKIDRASTDLQATMASARGAVGGKSSGVLGQVTLAAGELRSTVANLNALIVEANGPIGQISSSAVPQMVATLKSIQNAADRLDSLAYRIEHNPGAMLKEMPAKEVEIPR